MSSAHAILPLFICRTSHFCADLLDRLRLLGSSGNCCVESQTIVGHFQGTRPGFSYVDRDSLVACDSSEFRSSVTRSASSHTLVTSPNFRDWDRFDVRGNSASLVLRHSFGEVFYVRRRDAK